MPSIRRIRLPLVAIRAMDKLYESMPEIECKGLCAESCGPIAMSEFEWDRIAARHGEYPRPTAEQRAKLDCPMLKDGRCSNYDIRPVICRLWGVDERMPCPWGCVPKGGLIAGGDMLDAAEEISREHYK